MSNKAIVNGARNPLALGGNLPSIKILTNRSNILNSDAVGTTKQVKVFENKIGEELITKKELAEKLKYSVSYLNKLVQQSKIPYLKNGKCIRFLYSEVLAALKKESTA